MPNLPRLQLTELLCPADSDPRPHSSYAACHNDVEAPIDADNHGVFFLNSQLQPADITDGLAYTLFLAEKRSEPNQVELGWMSGTAGDAPQHGNVARRHRCRVANRSPARCRPRSPTARSRAPVVRPTSNWPPPARRIRPTYVGGFGSHHADGLVMAAMGDGSIRELSETIDKQLLQPPRKSVRRAIGRSAEIEPVRIASTGARHLEPQVASDAETPQRLPASFYGDGRPRRGIPLLTILLAIGLCAVLLVLMKPIDGGSPTGADIEYLLAALGIGLLPGGILAVILTLYCTNSPQRIVAGYFAGAAATAVAVRLLIAPQDIRVAIAGAALLLVFGLAVRLAQRKPNC